MRKPSFGISDTQQILYGLSAVLHGLNLFPGARILDFGAGTGWLSKILGFLDCEAIALDVSQSALRLGQRALENDPLSRGLKLSFLRYDGRSISLPDRHVDRIVCFDAFHHLADQASTLVEFFRVLRPGGTAAFHEPGPEHSRNPQSQYEMSHFGVIENDIRVEEIWETARRIGFTDIDLALPQRKPLLLPIDRFNKIAGGKPTNKDLQEIVQNIVECSHNTRIFFLRAGKEVIDSRHGRGLLGLMTVAITRRHYGTLCGTATVRNTGTVCWLPSGTSVGSVSLGVHLKDRAGTDVNPDYARIALSTDPIEPGKEVTVEFTIPQPAIGVYQLVFDLVSEHVTWFELFGTVPRVIQSDRVP